MSLFKSFETERLLLKPTSEDDAPFILELLNTPKWGRFIGERNVKSIDDAKAYIEQKITPQFQKIGFGNYTVIRKLDNLKIGSCGLYDREGIEGIDIGFAFLPQYEKMGYAFESAHQLKEVALHYFEIKKIGAITTKDNKDSQKLLKKLGLKFLKTVTLPNDNEDLLLYKL
ncbi:MAG: GNAT family N-acetyltransferase [Flavobacteriaceae bacterium]|nr:GNAT family N-acetyltransferase [Flavobacteriaceae bacterium]